MKAKNGQILAAFTALRELTMDRAIKMPIKLAFKIRMLASNVKEEAQAIEGIKSRLIADHTDGGREIDPSHENWEAFVKDYNELMDTETDIGSVEKLSLSDITEKVIGNVTLQQMESLEPFLSDQ